MSDVSNPFISIIMPVYNGETYLEQAINSALNQSLKNIELICIDDGSEDSSLDILRRIKTEDERVQVISQKNSGAGRARNAGLKIARGAYIAFLDSDDFYPDDTCLENIYHLALLHQSKIAGGSLLFLNKGIISKAATGDADFTFLDTGVIKYKDFQQAYYYQRFIYSRDMLIQSGIVFPEYRRFQDVVFFVNTMVEAEEFLSTDMPTYVYRVSNNYASLSDTQIDDMLRGYIDVLTIAKKKNLRKLFSFLSERIARNNTITKMVNNSIDNGNKTAGNLYPKVLNLCNCPFDDMSAIEEPATGLISKKKAFFTGSK